ncbi:nucleotidyltransferase family protein [Flagellimonas nanhaiensis]|uniref:Nucleotidyltransferase family protein n=1 Tax=Flagellimonas nanhaiensis TaxID=2292706 RepID=A0A371JUU9_9FLAO|nr:nucleotidyltransferase family protein [Allomuricauda nanhaiensis]RDY61584.1 nucleotidyltransferase family protein [Allomuricauda nanhaiensis]
MADSIAILILAAGSSSRMGDEIKQLLPWKNSTFLGHAIAQAKQVTDSTYVVLGANMDLIKRKLPQGTSTIENPNWKNGMGSSISIGVEYILKQTRDLDGLLIMTVDQPLLDAEYLNEMIANFKTKEYKIVATSYGKRAGVPAIFHKSMLKELISLHQDYGAKHVISENIAQTKMMSASGKEIDIDTLTDYHNIIN